MTTLAPGSNLIHFTCRSCALPLTVPTQLAGVEGPCPGCGHVIAAPINLLPEWRGRPAPAAPAPSVALPVAGTKKATRPAGFKGLSPRKLLVLALVGAVLAAPLVYCAQRFYTPPPVLVSGPIPFKPPVQLNDEAHAMAEEFRAEKEKNNPGLWTKLEYAEAEDALRHATTTDAVELEKLYDTFLKDKALLNHSR